MPDGKNMKYKLKFDQGFSNASINWILKKSYFNIKIQMKDKIDLTSRLLTNVDLSITNVEIINGSLLQLYSILPVDFSPLKNFIFDFTALKIRSWNNISYGNFSTIYDVE